MHGQHKCKMHGGMAPQSKRKALERIQRAEARKVADTYGLPVEEDPGIVICQEIARTNGHVLWLAQLIRQLDPDALVYGVIGKTAEKRDGFPISFQSLSITEQASLNVWLSTYQQERKHLAAICVDAIKCGIEQRRVELAEQTGRLLMSVVRSILDDPDLPAALAAGDEAGKGKIAARHLRSVA